MIPKTSPDFIPQNVPAGYVWQCNIISLDLSLNERIDQLNGIGIPTEDITVHNFRPKGCLRNIQYIAVKDIHADVIIEQRIETVRLINEILTDLNN